MYTKANKINGLTPITSEWMEEVMRDKSLIEQLISKYGSPVNLHHLPTFSSNIERFRELFAQYGLRHQIYYARKANKSKALVQKALQSGIGVDTASFRELEQSLALGGTGETLVLTSAIKTKEQYALAIKEQVPIILDNVDECELANTVAVELGKVAIVGFRVSGFKVEDKKLYSRFGFDIELLKQFILENLGAEGTYKNLNIAGLHFHLDGYSTHQRGKALSDCISMLSELNEAGFNLDFIDIGGGILINYLEDEQEWSNFDKQLRVQVASGEGNLTFNQNGLGYELINGNVERSLKTYPYYNNVNGVDFLKQVLEYKESAESSPNFSRLQKNNIEIRIEPGRSLLNQIGMTIAKVAHRKQDAKGQWLVGLEMNMSQMMSSSADFLLDPYLIYEDDFSEESAVDVFFTGAYCLERDVLLKRKITLPQLPKIGDLVAFVNTAGYMMHFFETEAHLFELSTNLSFNNSEKLTVVDFVNDDML
ncbi:Y4yA family PLP-dependent enzyme [Zunongwangia sp. HGR-M22]|uniref:Y4yA family PLP-dependent enzyme n=1 Tax=Zunongwangia sp. HGR-M22 TaxID=3015168 RepID=UPI0022DE259A|nr:Y4yA family PLP-dependent enzyme [Zunongwangia sp. HGR-M22]WBL26472.1 Y4yA family PLP-dependent enzyme [Zunongwangia sp. HGR-M22]